MTHICNENIGDEFHYLFICKSPELVRIRENLIPEYYTKYPDNKELSGLLSYCSVYLY
jgi:vacuolar-type H+-ATPase subunit B/Vma2